MSTSLRSPAFEEQLQQVRQEYLDTPNLRLTPSGAQRFFGLQPYPCMEILEALLAENFLCRTGDGLFVRSSKRD